VDEQGIPTITVTGNLPIASIGTDGLGLNSTYQYGDFAGGGGGSRTPSDANKDGNKHKDGCATGHPVIISSGNKVLSETDFKTHHLYPIKLERDYNHNSTSVGLFGSHWMSNFDRYLTFVRPNGTICTASPLQDATACMSQDIANKIILTRTDGSQATYLRVTPTQTYANHSADANDTFVQLADNSYKLSGTDGRLETYTYGGMITSAKDATGIGWTFSYTGSQLQSATFSSGLSVHFGWQNNHVTTVTDPAGQVYSYSYNSNGYLSSVAYPNNAPGTTATITRT